MEPVVFQPVQDSLMRLGGAGGGPQGDSDGSDYSGASDDEELDEDDTSDEDYEEEERRRQQKATAAARRKPNADAWNGPARKKSGKKSLDTPTDSLSLDTSPDGSHDSLQTLVGRASMDSVGSCLGFDDDGDDDVVDGSFAVGDGPPRRRLNKATKRSKKCDLPPPPPLSMPIDFLKVNELKDALRARGLTVSGKKQELADRLRQFVDDKEQHLKFHQGPGLTSEAAPAQVEPGASPEAATATDGSGSPLDPSLSSLGAPTDAGMSIASPEAAFDEGSDLEREDAPSPVKPKVMVTVRKPLGTISANIDRSGPLTEGKPGLAALKKGDNISAVLKVFNSNGAIPAASTAAKKFPSGTGGRWR
jgi:hypothetical protein